jgi:hypothetical protein
VAELAASGLAGILVPLPIAVDDDQGHNARALADFGAAWVMRQPDFTSGALAERLGVLLADPSALRDAGKAAGGLTRPDAAARLADLVELQMTSRFAEKKNFSTEKTESHGEPRRRAVQRLTLSADNRHFLHVMAEPCPWACPEDLPTTHDLFSVNGLKSWMAGTGSAMTWLTRRCRSANQAAPQGTAA